MDEPTKEAIEEAEKLREKFANHGDRLYSQELAQLIAHVRKKARDDALDRFLFIALQADTYEEIVCKIREEIEEHRALKDQPSGEQP